MKRNLIIFLFVAGIFMFSCKKEYTCECIIVQDLGQGDVSTSTTTSTFTETSTKKAKLECESDITQNLGGMSQTITCRLK